MINFEVISSFWFDHLCWFLKIRYKKIGDEDNWFDINEETGDLRTVKVLDRESKFVKNNQYNVSVVATDTGECSFLEIKYKYRVYFIENPGVKFVYFQIKILYKKCLHYDCLMFWRPPQFSPQYISATKLGSGSPGFTVAVTWCLPWTWWHPQGSPFSYRSSDLDHWLEQAERIRTA